MRDAVGASTHKTAAAMVKAADALWDARGGNDPTVAACNEVGALLLATGREATYGAVMPASKVAPLPA